jgi:hypothetical protein
MSRQSPLDVAWMRDWLDGYLDELGWPAVVSSSAIEDRVLATYPRWQTRTQRLREIISRALHAAGYERRSVRGKAWERTVPATVPNRYTADEEHGLIKVKG